MKKRNGGDLVKHMEVVCGILVRGTKVYIAKRKGKHAAGIWEFPGGKIEPMETAEAAVVRELEEELNVKARVKCYLCDTIDHQEGWEIHVSAFLCDSEDEPHDLNAHSEGCWIDADRVYDYPFQDADRIILDKLQEVMKC